MWLSWHPSRAHCKEVCSLPGSLFADDVAACHLYGDPEGLNTEVINLDAKNACVFMGWRPLC